MVCNRPPLLSPPPPPQAANAAQAANVVNFRPCRATFCFTFVS
jgi:hypothetical protein